jgi:DNA-binding transcriptional ArsR family regulator
MNAVKENSGKHKAWWAPVWQGLVMDPNAKHYQRMGQAVWLFLYFLLNANRRTGLLMRRSSTITAQTGYKPRTIRQWLKTLREKGYIRTKSTGRYLKIEICRWKNISMRPAGTGQSGWKLPPWAAQRRRTARTWERVNFADHSANFSNQAPPNKID